MAENPLDTEAAKAMRLFADTAYEMRLAGLEGEVISGALLAAAMNEYGNQFGFFNVARWLSENAEVAHASHPPGRFNIFLERGQFTWTRIQVTDPTGNPVDLTGRSLRVLVRYHSDPETADEYPLEITDPPRGIVSIRTAASSLPDDLSDLPETTFELIGNVPEVGRSPLFTGRIVAKEAAGR